MALSSSHSILQNLIALSLRKHKFDPLISSDQKFLDFSVIFPIISATLIRPLFCVFDRSERKIDLFVTYAFDLGFSGQELWISRALRRHLN